MTDLDRLLDPRSIAIVGISADPAKHGRRVLDHLNRLGFEGEVWGVNPGLPEVAGIEMFHSLSELPSPPDLVVCAVPASATAGVISDCVGVGAAILFAGGFAESGGKGLDLQEELGRAVGEVGVRLLGPNSGGVIRPTRGLAASFLTCLDRPVGEIRSGPVGVVTQSGGTGSYLHNLAAARGSGLAVSVSTGNEADIRLGEAIDAVSRLEEVSVVLALVETVRDGPAFIAAIRESMERGKPVVACRIGTGAHGKRLMSTHTGAMAVPERLLEGVLDSLAVVVAETPGEAYEIAEILARVAVPSGPRAGLVTHSGGIAIHLADLAERQGLNLPQPGPELRSALGPLLDHGVANNPLDMGGIIGGPGRFSEVVQAFAGSGEYDVVVAVSTAHPPAHTDERANALVSIEAPVPVIHLWMAGDQAASGLSLLRRNGAAVSDEPRAAVRAAAGLCRLATHRPLTSPEPLSGGIEDWGLPLIQGILAADVDQAVDAADRIGYPVVMKLVSPGLAHKSEVGGVEVGVRGEEAARAAHGALVARAARVGLNIDGVRVEPHRPGLELIVGGMLDPSFGPMVSVGLGGVLTEMLRDVVFAPAPLDEEAALGLVDRLRGRFLLDGYRGSPPADVGELARIVSLVSRGLVGSGSLEVEINPLIWDGAAWIAVDWLHYPAPGR